ncbi:glutamate racemase [Candidatus Uhrbacteria bacterium RIFOXYC2_FULL_47_19]|uniref:Glutamate racemase n=1 Tax=Candidatus Uhrbacteria bacterium RIFOXYC2_FULL_47_19 TaxID=1802424 RepID=A0A1F7WD59_9BACT|nr:MAG: glutamate racemase [Candidatus Uhrbacteria bacterium RIFOXYC2_FULL_47_19]HCC22255.1 glutamate racemase [Candidatus Uhrbacteria bacterium]
MIGVFDSGLGGLTVVKEIWRQLPGRGVVYLGDTARTPYGTKSRHLIQRYSLQDAEFLLAKGAKVIVVACNTASAQAVEALRRHVDVPVFEVVTPAVNSAAILTSGRVGVIGTRGTVRSGIYERKMKRLSPQTTIFSAACPLFVPLVEEGWTKRPETVSIAREYLRPLRLRRIDTLILGCTHYPFLRSVIRQAIGSKVKLIDPAHDTVAELATYLKQHLELDAVLRTKHSTSIYVSDLTERFTALAGDWLGRKLRVRSAEIG